MNHEFLELSGLKPIMKIHRNPIYLLFSESLQPRLLLMVCLRATLGEVVYSFGRNTFLVQRNMNKSKPRMDADSNDKRERRKTNKVLI